MSTVGTLSGKIGSMSELADAEKFGRVDPDGTVYVKTADGERSVGQIPDTDPAEALGFYVKRFRSLEVEVGLLEARLTSGTLSPDEAAGSIKKERKAILDANAVGDLVGLAAKLDALTPKLDEQRAVRKAEKAKQQEKIRAEKEGYVDQAEKLATGNDWRGGVNKFRDLLEKWKAVPRLDRATDDELWHRFSTARTTYTKRRKAQFSEQATKRDEAATIKRRIITEAEELSTSTDWGQTTGAFRDLMTRWKEAGAAPRAIDEKLWQTFRGLQDTFFNAKSAQLAEQDKEFAGNQQLKEDLLNQYEPRITPEKDLSAAKTAYRELADKWAEIGKVPRDAIRPLDQRMKALESSITDVETQQWERSNPEARARAEETADKLRDQIASYEEKATKAEARGDERAATEARRAADTYRSWLEQAEAAVADFSG